MGPSPATTGFQAPMSGGLNSESFLRAIRTTAARLAEHNDAASKGQGPVVQLASTEAISAELRLEHWLTNGMTEDDLDMFLAAYLGRAARLHHPGSVAHQVAVPDVPSAVAELVHGTTNNPMAIFEMGPAAATIELYVVDWMLEKIGWATGPDQPSAGVLTHGGSLANLTALLAARGTMAPDAWHHGVDDGLVVLAPPSCHYSITRAVGIMGLGADAVHPLPVDDREVVDPAGAARALDSLAASGLRPVALVANAPSTATGLHDPLRELGRICAERQVWFHVDAAHGAGVLTSETLRGLLDGIDLADSVTWDAHKTLRTAGLAAAVLLRDGRGFNAAFQHDASYLFYEDQTEGIDLIHRTVECTKAELGLKTYLNLAWRGEAALSRYIGDRYAGATTLFEMVTGRDGFSTPFPPQSNIVCFRYGTDNDVQIAIRRALLTKGDFHLSSAEVKGQRYLRATLMSPHTDQGTFIALLDAVEAAGRTSAVPREG